MNGSAGGEGRALWAACRSAVEAERVAAYEQLGRLLYRLLWPRVRREPRLQHLAEDCAQQALVKVWRQLEAGRGPDDPERFLAWSGRIATNALLDALRRLEPSARIQRSKRVALSQQLRLDADADAGGQPLAERLADPGAPDLEAGMAYAEIHALLGEIRSIASVSERSRTVLLRGFLEGWEDEELAEHLGTNKRNVHVIRCRDLAKLRQDAAYMRRLRRHYPAAGDAAGGDSEADGERGA
ncbi:MAG: sigma-70 family RNA polymerase sigma factor [Caldilineae bacterium]|nr:sigma-70 family RNA polymerase sigma factor [Chloroflexota bacterium]MCB9177102.1 sigma-70 family RNA polymerase sigma factor [Caldilineae bacterium]